MKIFIPSNGPTIFKMESNISLPIDSIVECFKESFIDLDKGKNNCPIFFLYDAVKLYVYFFKSLSESKFMEFCSKFFSDQFKDTSIIYRNLGINMFDFLREENAHSFNIILVEDVDFEFYSKKCDDFFYVKVDFDAYNLAPENCLQIQSAFRKYCKSEKLKENDLVVLEYKKFYELYLKISDEFYKVGFVYPVKENTFVKHFIILFLPREILSTQIEFLKKLVFSFQKILGDKRTRKSFIYSSENHIPEIFINAITSPHYFTIGADFEYEMIKSDGSTALAYSVLRDTVYKKSISPKLKRNKVGVDGNSSIGEFRTSPTKVNQLDKFFKDVERLILRTKKKVSEKYNDIEFNFIGRSYPLGFHIHFGIPKELTKCDFNDYTLSLINYFKKSVEHILDLIMYRYLYTLNSFTRWTSNYSSFNKFVKTRVQRYGVEYRLFPSSILLEDYHKTVISFSVDLIKKYFTKNNVIEIPLNKYYEIDESFYPVEFFEKLKKIKNEVKTHDSKRANYERTLNQFVDPRAEEPQSIAFINYLNKIEEMINLLNDEYLTDSFVYYSCYDSNDNPLQIYYSSKSYYDMVNRKQVILYGLFFSENIVRDLIRRNVGEFNETFLKMLMEAEEKGQLKENHEKVYSELSEKFDFLRFKLMELVK